MKVIKPPALDEDFSPENLEVFLAGSIEQSTADEWQNKLAQMLTSVPNLNLYNPRRDQWDSSWDQDIKHERFHEQVSWELDHLEESNLVVFYFDPKTKSPITLLELGLAAGSGINCIICCPQGFWRKGNVDILCKRYDLKQVDTLEEIAEEIISAALAHEQYVRVTMKGRQFDEV